LGEMFEGDSADTCARKFLLILIGVQQKVKRAKKVSKDPNRRKRKF
jgi:hypothetical protein